MHEFIVALADQPVARQQRARDQVARGRGVIAKADRLAANVCNRFHRPIGLHDNYTFICGRAPRDPDREWLDAGRALLRQHVGERPEIGDLDAPEPHRLDHRGIVGRDDELDILLQHLLQIRLQWLSVLDDGRGVLVRQQRDAQPRWVCALCEAGTGEQLSACQYGCEEKATTVHCKFPRLIYSVTPPPGRPPAGDCHRFVRRQSRRAGRVARRRRRTPWQGQSRDPQTGVQTPPDEG